MITNWVRAGTIDSNWKTDPNLIATEWLVSTSTIGISHLSTEYVLIPIAATKNGAAYDPTGDTVKFAFMPTATQVPQVTDWVNGAWDTTSGDPIYPYRAKCLVGPLGTTNLAIGTYVVYIQITDSPEQPVLVGGRLQIS